MKLYDLLFLVLLLTAAVSVIVAAWLALRRRFDQSLSILKRLTAGAGIYMAMVILTSVFLPRRVLKADAHECFDDWCIGVAGGKRTLENDRAAYDVDLRLSSRARRISQRENNLSVYLTDGRNSRYDSVGGDGALNVRLGPGESVAVRRSFVVPAEAKDIGLVITHEGGFPIGWFIIGYDTWFRKPAIVELAAGAA